MVRTANLHGIRGIVSFFASERTFTLEANWTFAITLRSEIKPRT